MLPGLLAEHATSLAVFMKTAIVLVNGLVSVRDDNDTTVATSRLHLSIKSNSAFIGGSGFTGTGPGVNHYYAILKV